jgi:FkbM family methyltransferase
MSVYTREFALDEFESHGETHLQQHLSGKLKTIFDVGCNIGEWAHMARQRHPDAEIHMFEVVPETYKALLGNIELDSKTIPNGFGLSDSCGEFRMKYASNHSQLSTYLPDLRLDGSVWRSCLTFTGDQYVESRNIDYIDFLKIDVEGAEGKVLAGFDKTLKERKIGIIQFEYGLAAILSRFLLVDAYTLLTPLGYHLGKLTPNGIQFHEYTLLYETFNGPDYVAVHSSKMHLF